MKDIMIDERYRIGYRIGSGGFGLVYAGTDTKTDQEVAMKLMHTRDDVGIVESEAETYDALSGGAGIPRVFWSGIQDDYYVLVHELLGPTLEDLLNYCDRSFSLKTTLLIADQALSRLKYIHSKGFLHRDIKPDNFLMGLGKNGNLLYTIDFGLAKEFKDSQRETVVGGRRLVGTTRYASLNVHNGHDCSWRDDLESLAYVLIYCAKGSLPWQGLKADADEEKTELVKKTKESTPIETLCEGLPGEFVTYLEYARSLGFQDKPDYAYLIRLFSRLFSAKGFEHDNVFDWTVKLFYEEYGHLDNEN